MSCRTVSVVQCSGSYRKVNVLHVHEKKNIDMMRTTDLMMMMVLSVWRREGRQRRYGSRDENNNNKKKCNELE